MRMRQRKFRNRRACRRTGILPWLITMAGTWIADDLSRPQSRIKATVQKMLPASRKPKEVVNAQYEVIEVEEEKSIENSNSER